MIGIVIVSHSTKLAQGTVELARGVAGPEVKIAAAGGLASAEGALGTDVNLVVQAIDEVYGEDGVLVLMDLGSAVLSAEMALEQLDEEKRKRVLLCDAPLVEGAVVAAVQARIGSPLDQVAALARGALAPKADHLALPVAPSRSEISPPAESLDSTRTLYLTIRNRLGLHARPAARLVQIAARAQAQVNVRDLTTGRGPANAKSINAIATLGVTEGHQIEVTAFGSDAQAVLTSIRALAEDNFGDAETDRTQLSFPQAAVRPSEISAAPSIYLQGLAASPGIALGPARHFRPQRAAPLHQNVLDPQREWDRLVQTLQTTRLQIQRTRDALTARGDKSASGLFDAYLLYLEDEALLAPARRLIFEEHADAAVAWRRAADQWVAEYRALGDEYLRGRAVDMDQIGDQVLGNLSVYETPAPVMPEPGILIAPDLAPIQIANLDPVRVLGICTAWGAPTSHSAVLARTLAIPMTVGLNEGILRLSEGTPLILDGDRGTVLANPSPEQVDEYSRRRQAARAIQVNAQATSAGPAITRDGRRIEIVANVGSIADARVAVAAGAEGVGVLRTEFLFLNRPTAPDEEEQYVSYRAIAEALGGRALIVRTLDVGGDKPLPYLAMDPEANPFLGRRAIRLCLAQPEFFKTQLRAIVRAAAEYPVKIMFPMIATLAEWRAARERLLEARSEVKDRGQPVPDAIETGIMVEIPAAALEAEHFAAEVDFFSIGTNDLVQYTMAAERGNPNVAALGDSFQPALLALIERVARAAHTHGKWVGVCGEMAGEALAVPVLIGLGIDELSMNPSAIPQVKAIIRDWNESAARGLAQRVLELRTSEDIRAYLQGVCLDA